MSKIIIFLISAMALLGGCTSSTTTTTSGGSMSPIQAAGCDVETAILGGAAQAVATALNCSSVTYVQASLTTALGNANLCANATVSSTKAEALKAKSVMKPMGIVGNLACPVAVNTIMGFLSNSIPPGWGCSATANASALSAALTAACESAVPI
jgi:hypothetical protein